MTVALVGGGVVGLTGAIALREAGLEATVYDRRRGRGRGTDRRGPRSRLQRDARAAPTRSARRPRAGRLPPRAVRVPKLEREAALDLGRPRRRGPVRRHPQVAPRAARRRTASRRDRLRQDVRRLRAGRLLGDSAVRRWDLRAQRRSRGSGRPALHDTGTGVRRRTAALRRFQRDALPRSRRRR